MKKEEFFNDGFLKQFKSGDELNGFVKELQKRGIEKMLEGELETNNKRMVMKCDFRISYTFEDWTIFDMGKVLQ